VLSTVVALALAASVVAVVVRIRRSDAVRQSHLAQSEEMAAESEEMAAESEATAAEATNLFSTDSPLAMLLSVQAYERTPTPQATSALIEAAGQPLGDLLGEGSRVESVAFSPGGRMLAVGDGDGDVGLWDTASGQRTATLAEGSPVKSVAFSRNGQTLAIGDLNGNVVALRQGLSDLTGSFLSRLICGEVRRNMTQAQWTANAPGQPYQKTCPAYP
jgi:WD domain, G-beta repeat